MRQFGIAATYEPYISKKSIQCARLKDVEANS